MLKALIAAAALALSAAPAAAEIVTRSENAFTLRYTAGMQVAPKDAAPAMTKLASWWDKDHTYTGDSANLSLDLSPGGCWCETLDSGDAFDHGRTVSVGSDRLVFDAPFGPLRGKATKAELVVEWPPANRDGQITWTFVVEGPGVGAMADTVDGVMGAGFNRFSHFLHHGKPSTEG